MSDDAADLRAEVARLRADLQQLQAELAEAQGQQAVAAFPRVAELANELAEVRADRDRLQQEVDRWRVCNTCGGAPHPDGHSLCVCGGTGSAVEELTGLRLEVLHAEQRESKLRAACTALPRKWLAMADEKRTVFLNGHPSQLHTYSEQRVKTFRECAADLDRVLHPQPQPQQTTKDDEKTI